MEPRGFGPQVSMSCQLAWASPSSTSTPTTGSSATAAASSPPPRRGPARHRRLIARPTWMIDGMKLGVLSERLQRADTVIYLDLPPEPASPAPCAAGCATAARSAPISASMTALAGSSFAGVCMFRRRLRPVLLDMLDGFEGEVVVIRRRRASCLPNMLDPPCDLAPFSHHGHRAGVSHDARASEGARARTAWWLVSVFAPRQSGAPSPTDECLMPIDQRRCRCFRRR